MNAYDVAELLWAVAADLQWAGDRLHENPNTDPAAVLAAATRSPDEFSRHVAEINQAVAVVISQQIAAEGRRDNVIRLAQRRNWATGLWDV